MIELVDKADIDATRIGGKNERLGVGKARLLDGGHSLRD